MLVLEVEMERKERLVELEGCKIGCWCCGMVLFGWIWALGLEECKVGLDEFRLGSKGMIALCCCCCCCCEEGN